MEVPLYPSPRRTCPSWPTIPSRQVSIHMVSHSTYRPNIDGITISVLRNKRKRLVQSAANGNLTKDNWIVDREPTALR